MDISSAPHPHSNPVFHRWGAVAVYHVLDRLPLRDAVRVPLPLHDPFGVGYRLSSVGNYESLREGLSSKYAVPLLLTNPLDFYATVVIPLISTIFIALNSWRINEPF